MKTRRAWFRKEVNCLTPSYDKQQLQVRCIPKDQQGILFLPAERTEKEAFLW